MTSLVGAAFWMVWIAVYITQVSTGKADFDDVAGVIERIIGGMITKPNEYPFMINLMLEYKKGTRSCGASLINSQYVLTAAHCLKDRDGDEVNSITVFLGSHNLAQGPELTTIAIKVEKWFYNKYDHKMMNNDVALLKLSNDVEFSDVVKPICLPPAGQYYKKGLVRALGWGVINDQFQLSEELREADLDVLPDSDCQNLYKHWFRPYSMMCAGYLDGHKDTCVGDSGGPVFIYDDNNAPTLVGLTSFANNGCGKPGLLAVYTRLASFTNWIVSKAVTGGPICFGTF